MKKISKFIVTVLFVAAFAIIPGIQAESHAVQAAWVKGIEESVFGHTFEEEYWTNGSVPIEDENGTTTFAVNYINNSGVEVFMVAANMRSDNSTNQNGTLPFQFYGMHYETPEGQEIFITAVFAFLYAFLDIYNGTAEDGIGQGLPDPGNEPFFYVYPFGVDDLLGNSSYRPIVEPLPVVRHSEGNYTFGIRYRNLYAKVLDGNNILSLYLSLGLPFYTIRFSELTIRYHVEIDSESGQVRTETFYDIGQVDTLWILGIEADIGFLNNESWGIGAAHYVSVFASRFKFEGRTSGNELAPQETGVATENLTMKVGQDDERAFDINLLGEYNLVNETTDTTVNQSLPATNILLAARPLDILFIGWQLPLAIRLLSVFAYSHSSYLQSVFTSPEDLIANASGNFSSTQLWYGVQFKPWRGLRVEHDPQFVAYANLGLQVNPGGGDPTGDGGGLIVIAAGMVIAIIVAVVIMRRRKSA